MEFFPAHAQMRLFLLLRPTVRSTYSVAAEWLHAVVTQIPLPRGETNACWPARVAMRSDALYKLRFEISYLPCYHAHELRDSAALVVESCH